MVCLKTTNFIQTKSNVKPIPKCTTLSVALQRFSLREWDYDLNHIRHSPLNLTISSVSVLQITAVYTESLFEGEDFIHDVTC